MENTKTRTAHLVVLLIIAILVAAGSLGFAYYSYKAEVKANKKIARYIDDQLERQAKEEEQINNYQEDGFRVMDQYEIRSTTNISDAYISGDDSNLSDEDKETLEKAKAIINEVTTPEMSNFEKELAIYEWLCDNINHGTSTTVAMPTAAGSDFTPQGVLKSKKAVCVGYATTFRMFMQMFGLECHIVHNDYHSWDLVKLDDDQWYHVDVYSDAGSTRYANFNMTDASFQSSHDWDTSALPAAVGTKYSIAVQRNKKVKNLYAIPKKFKKALEKKNYALFYSFEEQMTEDDLGNADVLISQLQMALSTLSMDNYSISAAWVDGGDVGYILSIFITDYNEMDDVTSNNISQEVGSKITDKVNEAFGTSLEYYGGDGVIGGADTGMTEEAVYANEDGK